MIFLEATAATGGSMFSVLISFGLVMAIMYFMMIRPQKKKDKQLSDMRNSLDIGDGVTTIGGITGRVVALKDDTLVIETGNDRTRIRFKRWAVQDVEKLVVE